MTVLQMAKTPWYREPWPWFLMVGPLAVIAAGVVTVWLAVKSDDGLVSDDYYKEGLAVNQLLKRDQGAELIGLTADVMRAGRQIRVLLLSPVPDYVFPEKVSVRLKHPTQAGRDQQIELQAMGGGMYSGTLGAEVDGRWNVSIEDGEGGWRLHAESKLDDGETLRLRAKSQ